MFTIEHAPRRMASAADAAETTDSSRHTGVLIVLPRTRCAEVLLVEGLLDEQQVEVVEARQVAQVGHGVCGVRVHLQEQAAPNSARTAANGSRSQPGSTFNLIRRYPSWT